MADLESVSVIVQHRDRILEVLKVFAKYGLAEVAELSGDDIPGFTVVRNYAASKVDPDVAKMTPGARLCAALGELGTAWIKLGQSLSTRPDIVGPTVAEELSQLQSAAPPDAKGDALATVEQELGGPVRELYGSFYRPVTASASVAEVHKATLKDHTRVVVKVVHHGAAARVTEDIAVMRVLAARLEEADAQAARYQPVEVIGSFAKMLEEALDLRNEAKNLELFRANFADDDEIAIPQPYSELSSRSVLTMTREEGRSMKDRHSIELAGWDVDELLRKAADVYLRMIFRDGFFHADPHPGNFLLTHDHKLAILDFGDVGRITPSRRNQLAPLALALVAHDTTAFVDGILDLMTVPAGMDPAPVHRDLTDWADEYFGEGVEVDKMDVAGMAGSFSELMRKFGLVLPSDLALLARTLVRIQGLAQSVGADVDLVSLIAPYAAQIARERLSPKRLLRDGVHTARKWTELIGALPDEISASLAQLRSGKVAMEFHVRDDDQITDRLVDGMLIASSVVAASQLASRRTPPAFRGVSVPALLALGLGAFTWYRRRKNGSSGKSILSFAAEALRRRS